VALADKHLIGSISFRAGAQILLENYNQNYRHAIEIMEIEVSHHCV
jgi:hypothetical protein